MWPPLRFYARYSGGNIYLSADFSGRANYELFTVDGRKVKSGVISSPVVNVGNLPQGVYFFQIKKANGRYRVARVVVLK
jgi:hypothetical protein